MSKKLLFLLTSEAVVEEFAQPFVLRFEHRNESFPLSSDSQFPGSFHLDLLHNSMLFLQELSAENITQQTEVTEQFTTREETAIAK